MKTRFLKSLTGFVIFAVLTAAVSSAEAFSPEYQKKELTNGATIVSRYLPESPLVTVQIRVLSGLSNEGKYASSGISHFLEHLIFKGTKELSASQIREKIKKMGGVFNGSTGLDSAEYHITVPKAYFKEALGLLSDMVMTPVFSDSELESEREVILREAALYDDDPVNSRMKLLFQEAYTEHVYRYPIIGYADGIKKLMKEDLLGYHGAIYTPERSVVSVVGGVPSEEAIGTVEAKFSGYVKGKSIKAEISAEPPQEKEKVTTFPADVTLGYVAIAFHTTDLYSDDLYPCDVLSKLIGEGQDSRLYNSLVKDKQLLYDVLSINYTPKYPGLFIITGVGDADKIERAKDEIYNIIGDLEKNGVSLEEVERAKKLIVSDYLHSHENSDILASSLSDSQLLTGDVYFFEEYVGRIKQVLPGDVRAVAGKYLVRQNSTTVFMLPGGMAEERSKELEGLSSSTSLPEKALTGKRGERSTPAKWKKTRIKIKRVSASNGTEEKEVMLGNGLKVIVRKNGYLPLVAATLAIPGGLLAEGPDENGIADLAATLILKGTKTRSEKEIIGAIEAKGGSITSFSGMNSMGVSFDVMSEYLDEALSTLKDVIANPVFPEEELEKQKNMTIADIKQREDDIFGKGFLSLKKALYGDHPYGKDALGDISTVEGLTRDDIVVFYKKTFAPYNAVLTVVGDVDTEETVKKIDKMFADWSASAEEIKPVQVLSPEVAKREDISMKKEQALYLLGFIGCRIKDESRYPLEVVSSIMSGSDGLLFEALRENDGVAYTSGAVSVPGVESGYYFVYSATTEENIEKVRGIVSGIIERVADGGVSLDTLESSKNMLIMEHALSLQANYPISMAMALDELYGLGYDEYRRYPDRIMSLQMVDITNCAEQFLNLDKSAEIVVHPEK